MRGWHVLVVVALISSWLASACGSDACVTDVPFSVSTSVDDAEAQRIAAGLGIATIADRCDDACAFLSDERTSPDGATFATTSVDSCTLVMPSTDAMGMPVAGSLDCSGVGDRCN